MSVIETQGYGRVCEHLVGDLPVFGRAAIELDEYEGEAPKTVEQQAELRTHASILSGRIIITKTVTSQSL